MIYILRPFIRSDARMDKPANKSIQMIRTLSVRGRRFRRETLRDP